MKHHKELLTYVLNYHNQEGKLNAKSLLGVKRSIDVIGGDVGSHNLKNGRLNIGISYPFNMSVSHLLVPNLERLGSE